MIRPVRRPYAKAAEAARALAARLGLREPRDVDLDLIAMALGAVVVPRPVTRGEGHLLRDGRDALVAIREDLYGTRKGRFVVAHEIGHLVMHAGFDDLPRCQGERVPPGARRIEGEASDFAAELTMPEGSFAPLCRGDAPTCDRLRDLADRFVVSPTSAALRALLYVDAPCAVVSVERGVVAWWACSAGFDVGIHRRARVHPEAVAPHDAADRVLRGALWGDAGPDVMLREGLLEVTGDGEAVRWMTRVPP